MSFAPRNYICAYFHKKTIFGLASTSKAFAALALGLVMDDFKHGQNVTALPGGLTEFTWTTKLKDILPEDWKLVDDWASEAISVRDFLSHVSGVPRRAPSSNPDSC
jgi:CubicO group peptidase (beta-lactamase class C family)